MANVGRQAASLVFDADNDGTDEFLIAGWSYPSMVWFKKTEKGWDKYIMDDRDSQIEAGGTCWDIDGDGDLDVVQGERYLGNHLWWWENPNPEFDPMKPWERYVIKDWGKNQSHDQIIGDIDGDGKGELIAWNQ